MNKVGIVSLYGNNNYGNKLQNYAVQETIKKYGYEVENIIDSIDSYSLCHKYFVDKYHIDIKHTIYRWQAHIISESRANGHSFCIRQYSESASYVVYLYLLLFNNILKSNRTEA